MPEEMKKMLGKFSSKKIAEAIKISRTTRRPINKISNRLEKTPMKNVVELKKFLPFKNDVRPTLKKARLQRKDNHDRDCVAEIFRASLEEFARSGRKLFEKNFFDN